MPCGQTRANLAQTVPDHRCHRHDLGAVAIIALAYTEQLNTLALGAAAAILIILYVLGKSGVVRLWPYLIGAVLLWYAVLLSGVHATVAGVLTAAVVPIVKTPGAPDSPHSPLHRIEHALAPWVAFLVVPLFGFADAGISLAGIQLRRHACAAAARRRRRTFPRQADRHFRGGVAFGPPRSRRAAQGRDLAAGLWRGRPVRDRLHDEPVHRHARLPRPACPDRGGEDRHSHRLVPSAILGFLLLRIAPPHPRQAAEERRMEAEIERDGDVASNQAVPSWNKALT